ncbi:LegC family aminotransferase [Sedimenticola sp.]|uniref:LegC family aminotransferase n=1 Tax=Sedimenticola sp. TaxID=1940285 RepID=UPI003D0F79A0
MIDALIQFVRAQYQTSGLVPLHAPIFLGREKEFVCNALDSTFVSSVGQYVDKFEQQICEYTNSPSAVATVNGTAALHVALKLAGVRGNDLVITQSLTFVATCNAIAYCNAEAVFMDVNRQSLGLCPKSMKNWLEENAYISDSGECTVKSGNRVIRAAIPMHTFGHPVDLDELVDVCRDWRIVLIEDAAESLGSLYKGRHTGTFGQFGTLSFNGNKIITTGGGGMVLSGKEQGIKAKHITTTAKIPHAFEYVHDEVAYNYRLPNLNAALGCGQMESLEDYILSKRQLAERYCEFFSRMDCEFVTEPQDCRSNYWLNSIICSNRKQKDEVLEHTNKVGIQTRPIWRPMHKLQMFENWAKADLAVTEWLSERVVNLPSSVLPISSEGGM